MNRAISTVFAAVTVAVLAAAPAQAFKLEDGSGSTSGGSNAVANDNSPFYGPKKDLDSKDGSNGVYKWGGGELRVGSPGNPQADFRTGWDRMFNSPLGRPGQ